MIYRCLVHKPTKKYCGQIVGEISDWDGLAACADAWAILCVDDDDLVGDTIDLGHGCIVSVSAIRPLADPDLIGGGE